MSEERIIKRPLPENPPYFTYAQISFRGDPEFKFIGNPLPSIEGFMKASGAAKFTSDIKIPGMLYAMYYTSPYAHARAKNIDVSEAWKVPGVVDILVYNDPILRWEGHPEGKGSPPNLDTNYYSWMFILPSEAVWEGQPVAVAVCAKSVKACYEALKRIKIEWEELPFVLDTDEAAKPDAPVSRLYLGRGDNIIRPPFIITPSPKHVVGDIEKGFRESDKIIEFEIYCPPHTLGGTEPINAIAWYHGDGYLEVWPHQKQSTLRVPSAMREWASFLTGVPIKKVKIHDTYMGATFGGILNPEGGCFLPISLAIIFAVRNQGKPVMVLSPWANFSGYVGEETGHFRIKVGFKNDGTVKAVHVNGTFAWPAIFVFFGAPPKLVEATRIENIVHEGIFTYLNIPYAVCYRHGTGAAIPFQEVFSRVAAELKMDPTEVALKNDGCHGHPMHPDMDEMKRKLGFPVRDSLKECIEAGKKAIGWDEKYHPPGAKKLPNGKYHGLGFAWLLNWANHPGRRFMQGARLFFMPDGKVHVFGSRACWGSGDEEVTYRQIIAEESGLRLEDIILEMHDYHESQLFEPGGSSGLAGNAFILKELGVRTKQKILEVAAEHFKKRPVDLEVKDSIVFEKENPANKISVTDLVKRYMTKFMEGIFADGVALYKNAPVFEWGRQVAFIEIEVDPETGEIDVKKLVIVHDAGKVINPNAYAGQLYGGAFMGLEKAWLDEIVHDPLTGVKLNDSYERYPALTIIDIFPMDCIAIESRLGYGAYGNFGVGENVGVLVRTVLRDAVYNAIGKWINEDPITPDKVLKALGKA
ncbi:MAG: molybdopterin cofactor-binding domain-containing protein [Candidatus Bathyarchaeia archaeon]